MQAMNIRRFAVNRVGIAAIAIGTLAITIVGATSFDDVASTDHRTSNSFGTNDVQAVDPVTQARFIEQNDDLPGPVVSNKQSVEAMLFLESNLYLPGPELPATPSYDTMRFVEINTWLPVPERALPMPDPSRTIDVEEAY